MGALVYLLYTDESGLDAGEYFVVGGLAVHEQDARLLARDVESVFAALPPRWRDAELHAQYIRAGKNQWRGLPAERRARLTDDVATLLTDRPAARSPVLFAVALHKDSFPNRDPHERAYEDFFARCNGMLGRLTSRGDPHRCVVIADDSRLEQSLQRWMLRWRERGASTGAAIGPLSAYAEAPLFVDSRASRLVQLADFVAHWVYRAYEAGDESVFRKLLPGFDQEDGRIHGLVHLVYRYYDCACLACGSRRSARE